MKATTTKVGKHLRKKPSAQRKKEKSPEETLSALNARCERQEKQLKSLTTRHETTVRERVVLTHIVHLTQRDRDGEVTRKTIIECQDVYTFMEHASRMFDKLQHRIHITLRYDDFDEHEIASVVKSAYAHVAENLAKEAAEKGSTKVQSSLSLTESAQPEEAKDENPDGEAFQEQTPTFANSVFEALPDLLSAGLKYVRDSRERDMLLLVMITVISSLLHSVTAYYARKRYWADLYCFVVAAAASNKGVLEYALALCKYYFKEIADNNDPLENRYKQELEAYEESCRSNEVHHRLHRFTETLCFAVPEGG